MIHFKNICCRKNLDGATTDGSLGRSACIQDSGTDHLTMEMEEHTDLKDIIFLKAYDLPLS